MVRKIRLKKIDDAHLSELSRGNRELKELIKIGEEIFSVTGTCSRKKKSSDVSLEIKSYSCRDLGVLR